MLIGHQISKKIKFRISSICKDIINYLLPLNPHQSLLGESLGEKVVAPYYTHCAFSEPLNILN